ncbi:MAG: hypothetical protein ACLGIR_07990 [Actinomycetes bacterium]
MGLWALATVVAVGLLVLVVVTLLADTAADLAESDTPSWDAPAVVANPQALRALRPRLVWRGYDPVTVDAALAVAADRIAELERHQPPDAPPNEHDGAPEGDAEPDGA